MAAASAVEDREARVDQIIQETREAVAELLDAAGALLADQWVEDDDGRRRRG